MVLTLRVDLQMICMSEGIVFVSSKALCCCMRSPANEKDDNDINDHGCMMCVDLQRAVFEWVEESLR